MKILIINLPRYNGIPVTREGRCELLMYHIIDTPATLLIITSLLRKMDYQINFLDANALNLQFSTITQLLKNKKYDCIIFTFNFKLMNYDLQICDIVKNLNPTCITIGYSFHAKNFSKEILNENNNLDILIIDDPFSIIELLIKTLNSNENLARVNGIAYRDNNNLIKINPKMNSIIPFEELPIPAYEKLISFNRYFIYSPILNPYVLIYTGKGCPYECNFCISAKTRYSGKPAEKIVKELKLLKKIGNVKYVRFFDENFTINRKRVIKICKGIIKEKLKIKWICQSRVDLVDPELLKLMRKAGCIGISYGVESGSQEILNSMNKGIKTEQAEKALKWTRKAGIPINLDLLLGYNGENKKTLKETELFIKSVLPEILEISIIELIEGTEFYNLAFKKKWIRKDLNWKINLMENKDQFINYEPFKINLWEMRRKFSKMRYYNLKWWLFFMKTLIRNRFLILPILDFILKNRTFNVNREYLTV